ncbi:FAD binding domain-containing protein [Colletotrichum karsti]|uniref:FAD binding domain-containing protein n=1 Tax=Colletotrichum karsti TaxID=1095194 RepID=A0A9P6I7W0_9PEZI|nr:FAD binding domain-containing protein [Colletotrichum karsti]KAF9877490.1 FAD binding domain-containing protein [Colletotrichum karsti]
MKFSLSQAILALILPTALGIYAQSGRSPKCVCCSALAKDPLLQGKVLAPNTTAYSSRLESYYSSNSAQASWCMVLPTSTSDVSNIAKIISKHQCPFGMRSGAHSAWKGSNAAENGITIDFGHMNATTYDKEKGIASIQPGSDWERVFNKLRPHGVTTVGGRASVVGVGGFVTGGGYSFHTNAYGFACDMVANFEIVLGNGTVVNANSRENPELWKAQKGSSGNLGFVTRIDEYVVESTDMWGGLTQYDPSVKEQLFEAFINFSENMHADPASQNIVGMSWGPRRGYALRSILTNSAAVQDAPAFNEYMTIRNISSTSRVAAVAEMVPEFTGPTPLGLYANWLVGQFKNSFDMMKFVNNKLEEYGKKMDAAVPDGTDYDVLVQFQPFTQSIVDKGLKNGGNVLGLEDVVADGPTTNWLIVLTVDTPANQDKLLPLALQLRDDINAESKRRGVYKDLKYLNYAWGDQNPIATYGEKNVAFIKSVASRVDPDGVFQKLRKTGFKLPA